MRFPSRPALLTLVCGALLLGPALVAQAAETSNSEFVIIQEDDVFPDDLYAGAIRVVVDGRLEGDLIAFAAEEVVINGEVTGSVIAATPAVRVNGSVGGSLRVATSVLTVDGEVAGDIVAAARVGRLGPESAVDGDVIFWGWRLTAEGRIGEDLTGTQRNLRLAGEVAGDVGVSVTELEITGPLRVGGDLGYRSEAEATGLDQADVAGAVVHKSPLPPNLRVRALGVLGRFMVVLFLSIAALTVAYGWPNRASDAIARVSHQPVRKWLRGAVLIFAPLIAVAVTTVIVGLAPAAAAFPLLAVLIPVILALIGLSFAAALVAGAPVAGWLGGALFKRLDLYGSVLLGSLLLGLSWYVPWVGWLVPLIVLPLGLGSWLASWSRSATAEPVRELS